MPKAIIKATKSTPFMVVMGLVIVAAVGFVIVPQITKADVGTIVFSGVNGSGTGPYDAFGTWQPVGGQPCYNKGEKGFRYYIEVFEDISNNQTFDAGEPVLQAITPAPCGNVFSGTPSTNLTDGGTWPATGQTPSPATFTLAGGTHHLCSVLRHVSKNGNDIEATSCLANPINIDTREPQVTMTKTDNTNTSTPDSILTYQITLTETTDEVNSYGVKVEDTVPAQLTSITNISDSGFLVGNVITWNNITVNAGSTKILSYQGTVDPNIPIGTSILTNTANLGCGPIITSFSQCLYVGTAVDTTSVTVEPPPVCGDGIVNQTTEQCDAGPNGSTTCSKTCTSLSPTLTLAKSVDKTFANPNDTLTYTLKVTNTGTGDATNVTLTDTLPAGLTYLDSNGNVTTDTTKSWTWPTIAAGASQTVTYKVHVDSHATAKQYVNTASVSANGVQAITAQATSEVRLPVVLGIQATTLSITKSVNEKTVNPGGTLTFTVTVTNIGSTPSLNTTLTDTLPQGMVFAEFGETTHTWNLGDLVTGQSAIRTYDVKIDSGTLSGKYVNTATAKADSAASVTAQANIEVLAGKVLGEETDIVPTVTTLPSTGVGLLPSLIAGLSLLGSGLILSKRIK